MNASSFMSSDLRVHDTIRGVERPRGAVNARGHGRTPNGEEGCRHGTA